VYMDSMFKDATAFDQDLGSWDVSALKNASSMFNGVKLSPVNYDALLIGWEAQALRSGVTFSGGNSTYCLGESARANMISADQWTITDGGKDCNPLTVKKVFQSQAKYDGWVLESSEFSRKGGTKNNLDQVLQVGDNAQDKQHRVILSFYTGAIPDNAVITKVILKVKKAGVVGTDPMNTHKSLVVDIKKGKFYTLPALQINDFQTKANKYEIGKFSKKLFSGWYKAVLNSVTFPYINKTGRTQLRLRFLMDDNDNNVADILKLYSGNAVKADRPQLIVRYQVP
jgi:hypothetical protein